MTPNQNIDNGWYDVYHCHVDGFLRITNNLFEHDPHDPSVYEYPSIKFSDGSYMDLAFNFYNVRINGLNLTNIPENGTSTITYFMNPVFMSPCQGSTSSYACPKGGDRSAAFDISLGSMQIQLTESEPFTVDMIFLVLLTFILFVSTIFAFFNHREKMIKNSKPLHVQEFIEPPVESETSQDFNIRRTAQSEDTALINSIN